MRNISDIIEAHLKEVIGDSKQKIIEIKRSEMAEMFQCVPSQINYVIKTRFTTEKGFVVESKRGGGGYIRIIKIQPHSSADLLAELEILVGNNISQASAESIIDRLLDEEIITTNESRIIKSALSRQSIAITLPYRDQLRANILKSILTSLRLKYTSED